MGRCRDCLEGKRGCCLSLTHRIRGMNIVLRCLSECFSTCLLSVSFTHIHVRRRDAWLSAQRAKEAESSKRKGKGKASAASRKSLVHEVVQPREAKKPAAPQRLPKTTCVRDLQKVHPDSAPGKYLLLARVVDYWPENIEDFVSLYCSNCQQE